jgi:hypothetical protein
MQCKSLVAGKRAKNSRDSKTDRNAKQMMQNIKSRSICKKSDQARMDRNSIQVPCWWKEDQNKAEIRRHTKFCDKQMMPVPNPEASARNLTKCEWIEMRYNSLVGGKRAKYTEIQTQTELPDKQMMQNTKYRSLRKKSDEKKEANGSKIVGYNSLCRWK